MYSRQLKIFTLVAEKGSLSKAAEELFVTPAAIMKHMNNLEARLGLTLLTRTNQGIQLTEAGNYLREAARKMISAADDAVLEARAIQAQAAKTIRVGSSFLNPGKVLIDLWNQIKPGSTEYRIKIIPYDDDNDRILSVVASLGKTLDFMVGALSSKQILNLCSFYELGRYRVCVAVPRNHRLASRGKLEIRDFHGEHLIAVKNGLSTHIDKLKELLKMTHPQIILEDSYSFYDMDTFNACEVTGFLLLTLDTWRDVHPSLVTLPVEWDFTVPYGLLFSDDLSPEVASFLDIIKKRR